MKRGPFIAGAGLLGVIALVPALVPSAVAADDQYGATVPYTRYEAEEASRSDGTGGVWVFRTVCFERVVLSSPGCLWPGRMDDHEEVLEAHA